MDRGHDVLELFGRIGREHEPLAGAPPVHAPRPVGELGGNALLPERQVARADEAIDRDLARYLPLWKKCVPPMFADRPWRVDRWGAGERFVFAPYPSEKLEDVMAAIHRWGMGREMHVTEFDRLALSLA